MAYFHPYSPYGKGYFVTTPLAINVKGKIVEVYVSDDRHLEKGEKIFKIDPRPFESVVKNLEAKLALAKKRLKENTELYKKAGGRLFDIEQREAEVTQLESQLIKANFDLNNTTVVAPVNGHLIQNRLSVGTMAGVFKVSSLATFVPDGKTYYIAGFRSNGISNIKEGAKAEIFFVSKPGKVFKARVKKIWKDLREGQLLPAAQMKSVTREFVPGRVPVEFEILDDISGYDIPRGSTMGATVYSTHLEFLAELRSIFFHMFSWGNIINFEAV